MSFENSMILPTALSGKFFIVHALASLRVANAALVSLSLTWTVVGGRRFRPSVAVVDGRHFRPTSGQLESDFYFWTSELISMFVVLVQQRSEPLVEEWNMPTTSVVGYKQVFSVLMDAAVSACTFRRPSFVVKYNQLYTAMRNVRACFYDVTTRMLSFLYCGAQV